MNFDLNTSVRFADGEAAGRLTRVVLDPVQNAVLSAVVQTTGLLSREVVVPADRFSLAPGDVAQLDLDPAALDACPDFTTEEYTDLPDMAQAAAADPLGAMGGPIMPVMTVQNVPDGSVVLSQDTAVLCADGRVGTLDEVVTGDGGAFLAVIVRPDDADAPAIRVDRTLIAQASDDALTLSATLASLPQDVQPLIEEWKEPEPQDLL